MDPILRITPEEALAHPWIVGNGLNSRTPFNSLTSTPGSTGPSPRLPFVFPSISGNSASFEQEALLKHRKREKKAKLAEFAKV